VARKRKFFKKFSEEGWVIYEEGWHFGRAREDLSRGAYQEH
jgi:hypothetical protein